MNEVEKLIKESNKNMKKFVFEVDGEKAIVIAESVRKIADNLRLTPTDSIKVLNDEFNKKFGGTITACRQADSKIENIIVI